MTADNAPSVRRRRRAAARPRVWRLELLNDDGTPSGIVGSYRDGLHAVDRAVMLTAPCRVVQISTDAVLLLVVPEPRTWPLVSATPAGYRALARCGWMSQVNAVHDLEHTVTPLPSPDAVRARWRRPLNDPAVEAAAPPAAQRSAVAVVGLQGGAATPVPGSEPALAGGTAGPVHGGTSGTGK